MNERDSQPLTQDAGVEALRTHIAELEHRLAEWQSSSLAHATGEDLFRVMTDTAPVMIWISDEQGQCTFFNQPWLKFTGRTMEQEMGNGWSEGVHPDDLQRCLETYLAALRDRRSFRMEYRLRRHDGEYRWLLDTGAPRHTASSEYIGYVGSCIDITERHETERERDQFFRLSIDMLCIADFEGHMLTLNLAWERTLGFSIDELMSRPWIDFVHPEDRAATMSEFERLALGLPSKNFVNRYRCKDGSYRVFSWNSAPFLSEGLIYAVARDITDNRLADEALQEASRLEATATLAGGVAHDFNNLMVAVLGNAELLSMDLAENPELLLLVGDITRAAEKAGQLAQQLLAFARGGKYQPRVMNLNTTIIEVLHLEKHAIPPRISVESRLAPNLWHIDADPTQMTQVVMNLCINAFEAIEGAGKITITTENVSTNLPSRRATDRDRAHQVCLRVQDTGGGMDARTRARIFEPFFTTKFKGRGLGLAALYGIVKNHAGHVNVESEPGRGTTFAIYLPASKRAPIEDATAQHSLPRGEETILVVDDETMVLEVTCQMLERLGYTVLTAEDGRRALEIARTHPGDIALTILDLGMPGLSGAEVQPLLKEIRPAMRIVLASGYELDARASALLETGASDFISKPFRMEQLAQRLRTVLDSRSQ